VSLNETSCTGVRSKPIRLTMLMRRRRDFVHSSDTFISSANNQETSAPRPCNTRYGSPRFSGASYFVAHKTGCRHLAFPTFPLDACSDMSSSLYALIRGVLL